MQELAIEYYIRNFFALSENDKGNALLALSKISEQVLAVMTAVFSGMICCSRKSDSESQKLQRCMIQYMAGKQLAVHTFVTSKHIVSVNDDRNVVYDYTPALSIVRSMYEMLLVHHSIFFTSCTDEEQSLLINIWKYKGLRFPAEQINPDLQIAKDAIQERKKFQKNIEGNSLHDLVNFKKVNGNNLVYFVGAESDRQLKYGSYTDGWEMMSCEKAKNLYPRLCAETHVTYLGLMLYEQQNNISPNPQLFSLYYSCAFMCYMLHEIMETNKGLKKILTSLDAMQQKIYESFIEIL